MRVFAQTALELALLRAGLIQVPLHYRLLVSLVLLDAISCAGPPSHNLIWRCKRVSNSRRARRLHLEWEPTICSIIRILQCQATRRVRLPWEAMETPSSKTLRVISRTMSDEYSLLSVLGARFNWTHVSLSRVPLGGGTDRFAGTERFQGNTNHGSLLANSIQCEWVSLCPG